MGKGEPGKGRGGTSWNSEDQKGVPPPAAIKEGGRYSGFELYVGRAGLETKLLNK